MRLLILISVLLTLSLSEGNAQTFDYFENDPEWRMSASYNFNNDLFDPAYLTHEEFIYYLNGDSVINDTVYHQVFARGEHTDDGSTGSFDNFRYFVRQEEKRIYRRYENVDTLLFDFNLEVGDVFPDVPFFQNESSHIVESTDSILINNNYHKIFYGLEGDLLLLEGIGHSYGVFNQSHVLEVNGVSTLHCYRQGDVVFYTLDEWIECNFDVGIEEESIESVFSLYPNPTTNNLSIESSGSLIQSVQIYSQSGKLVYSDMESRSKSLDLELSKLDSGVYFVQIINASGSFTEKLVKE